MHSKSALFVSLALLLIIASTYARPSPEQYWPVMKDEAMSKFQDFDTTNYDAALLYHDQSAITEDKFVQDSVHQKLNTDNSDQISDESD
ncbi:hypothetical protein AgCh_024202 [Apium graveolens]